MRSTKDVVRRRAWLGAAALGTLVYGLAVAGPGSLPKSEQGAPSASSDGTTIRVDATPTLSLPASTGRRPVPGEPYVGSLPVTARVVVDYTADQMTRDRAAGLYQGPMPMQSGGQVAAGGCTFAVDCDDANDCTIDTCNIAPGSQGGTGKCEHNPFADGLPAAVTMTASATAPKRARASSATAAATTDSPATPITTAPAARATVSAPTARRPPAAMMQRACPSSPSAPRTATTPSKTVR
jgi:hypothetical protein